MAGTDIEDTVGMKRWLAFLEGGLLPIISLTSLHFFVKYEKPEEVVENTEKLGEIIEEIEEIEDTPNINEDNKKPRLGE